MAISGNTLPRFSGFSADRGPVITGNLFGAHWHPLLEPVEPTGFTAARLWDNAPTWRALETSKGVWTWTQLDARISALGRPIILTLGQAPGWASGTTPPGGEVWRNPDPPTNNQDWADYVTELVARYAGSSFVYEIWNEPNVSDFWSGTTPRLVELASIAYPIIKSIDPTATVISPGMANSNSQGMGFGTGWLRRYLDLGGAQYCDGIGYHTYVQPGQPETILPLVNLVKSVASEFSLGDLPLYITEYGWNSWTDDGVVSTADMPEETAAAYIARSILTLAAAKVSHADFYGIGYTFTKLKVVEDGSSTVPTLAGQAVNWLSQLLIGGRVWNPVGPKTDSSVYSVMFETSDGRTGRAFWCPDGETETVDISLYREASDIFGATVQVGLIQVANSPILAFR